MIRLEVTKYNLENLKQNSIQFLYKLKPANKLTYVRRNNVNAKQLQRQTKQYILETAAEGLEQRDKKTTIKLE